MVPRDLPHQFMEDGTAHFQEICALRSCFEELHEEGGMKAVAIKAGLCMSMEAGMRALAHSNGGFFVKYTSIATAILKPQ